MARSFSRQTSLKIEAKKSKARTGSVYVFEHHHRVGVAKDHSVLMQISLKQEGKTWRRWQVNKQ